MNRTWLVLLLALLLCGCRNQQAPMESFGESVPAIAVTEPTEPVGFYAPESLAEITTDGAVKAFPLGLKDVVGFRFLGEDILLFSGYNTTTLTLLSGETKYIKAQRTLPCIVLPDDPAVVVDARGMVYPDHGSHVLVTLNDALEEIGRIAFPDNCSTPVLSADRHSLYYCTGNALRVLDLETGLDMLLRETVFPVQKLTALHCNDSIIQCVATYDEETRHRLFFSTDTGALLYENTADISLWTYEDFYVARHMDGDYPEWLVGSRDSEPQVLVLEQEPTGMIPIPDLQGMLTYCSRDDNTVFLECYQLEAGSKIAQVTVPGIADPVSPQWQASRNALWFLSMDDSTDENVLYVWFPEASAVPEEDSCLQPRWTRTNPDLEGLAQCSLLARQISEKHGVTVLIWADAVAFQPWDYTLIPEYQAPLLRRRLEELDSILSHYPEGFLKKAASGTGFGPLSICLVRSIEGNADTPALDSAMGLQFWDAEAHAYLAITLGADMAQHLNHELFHIIDSRVLSTCNTYDDWNKLNPKGFSYDTQYTASYSEERNSYLAPENRYFIDLYSMTYPKEDRARIMEYAMLDGQEYLFQSAPMQAKLRKLCLGIRKTFDLEKEPVVYRWEQYLTTPLVSIP